MNRSEVERQGKWLLVRFPEPHLVMSWAIVRGGKTQTDTVAWYRVTPEELKPPVEAKEFLEGRLIEASIPNAVGLLTSADLDGYADVEKTGEDLSVRSIATVGLANALRVGDLPELPAPEPVGTINLLCQISRPLSREAFLEALALAAEARTTALLESGVVSTESGMPATGTGTDCIVIAAPTFIQNVGSLRCRTTEVLPVPRSGKILSYAGKHTLLGHLIGASVLEAVRSGIKNAR